MLQMYSIWRILRTMYDDYEFLKENFEIKNPLLFYITNIGINDDTKRILDIPPAIFVINTEFRIKSDTIT